VDEDRLRRFCLKGEGPAEGQVMMNRKVRDKVTFGQLNLCKPFEALGPFDVIFLRNVLIYFDAKTKVEVVDRVVNCLNPGGLFFLGTAEGRVSGKVPLTPIVPGAFRKPV
jgi:chemotaxis protein methyltransferase CheR